MEHRDYSAVDHATSTSRRCWLTGRLVSLAVSCEPGQPATRPFAPKYAYRGGSATARDDRASSGNTVDRSASCGTAGRHLQVLRVSPAEPQTLGSTCPTGGDAVGRVRPTGAQCSPGVPG